MATTTNKLTEPYSSNMPYFILTSSNTPEELVKAATILLSAVKEQPKLTNEFRMEVEISDEFCFEFILIWYHGMTYIFATNLEPKRL